MTDPLRPFADIIRALWNKRTQSASRSSAPTNFARADFAVAEAAESLRSRLISRINRNDSRNISRMRETFVETVLLWELGEHLNRDPGLGEMVTRVAEQLGSDPAVGERLDGLLLQLASEGGSR